MTEPNKLFSLEDIERFIDQGDISENTASKIAEQLVDTMRENERLRSTLSYINDLENEMPEGGRSKADFFEFQFATAQNKAANCLESYKHLSDEMGQWFAPHNKDGGCQMPYKVVEGFCAVCGSPNRSCQPDKQPKTRADNE